jgi:hypothetical protein
MHIRTKWDYYSSYYGPLGSNFSETFKTQSSIDKRKIRILLTILQQWAISGLN